ncbi:hypothetical protein OAC89_01880 [Deltaproteobacteria bacterium]|nr:hypothetical protein [Deltaproteobacteria bacterium]
MKNRLIPFLKFPSSVTITDNSSSIISVKREVNSFKIRLHNMFLDADKHICEALADFINGHVKEARKTLKAYIKRHEWKIRKRTAPAKPRKIRIKTQGRYFDLLDSFKRLNESCFKGKIDCLITWGNYRRRPGRKSVRLGSYSPKSSIIRINPVLDRSFVPQYVIDDVTYHEMLHHLLGHVKINNRRFSHHRAFKRMESKFIYREKSRLWIKKNLYRLLD